MRRENGFGFIEVLISLAVSLVLLAGLMQVFFSANEGYRLHSGLAEMQDNGRVALGVLRRDILVAGYPDGQVSEGIIASKTIDGGGSLSDTVTVFYRSDKDCGGFTAPLYGDGKRYAKHTYYIRDGSILICRVLNEDNEEVALYEMLEGVENMQLLYGIDNELSREPISATRYVSASGLIDWGRIVSMRIGVLVSSTKSMSSQKDVKSFQLLHQKEIGAANDFLRRRPYSMTVKLRNLSY